MIALWVLVVLVFTGWRALGLAGLSPRGDRLAFAGWAIAAGLLMHGALLFAMGWGFPGSLRPLPITLAQGALVLALGLLGRRRARGEVRVLAADSSRPCGRGEVLFRVAVGLAVGLLVLRAVVGDLTPALTGDEGMLWGLKARAIASAGGLGDDYLALLSRPVMRHGDYPLLNPLLQAWVLSIGDGGALLLRLPMQLGALGLVLSFAAALRRVAGPALAAALVLAFAASPVTALAARTAGAEGLVALGLVIAVDALGRFERDPRGSLLGIAAMGLALAVFTKNDASLFVLAILAGAFVRGLQFAPARPRLRSWAWLALPAAFIAAGFIFNARAGFANDLTHGKGDGAGLFARLGAQGLEYLPTTAEYFARHLFLAPRFDAYVLLLLAAALLVTGSRALAGHLPDAARLGRALVPAAAFALSLAGLFLIYLATPQPLEWHLDSSCVRVAWQVLPLASLALATLLSDLRPTP